MIQSPLLRSHFPTPLHWGLSFQHVNFEGHFEVRAGRFKHVRVRVLFVCLFLVVLRIEPRAC
jgi:hypothetical protein